MAEVKYIVFSLGRQKYGVKLSVINGIEKDYNVVPIPVGAEYMKGIIHLRGEIVPLFDLKSKFNICEDTEGTEEAQLLVSETHGIKLGIEVDDVLGIIPVEEEDIKKVPNVVLSSETGYLENVVKVIIDGKEDIIISISVDKIMSDSDFESVSNAIDEVRSDEE